MTIEDQMRLRLRNKGLFDNQIDSIMKRVKEANKSVKRWGDEIELCPLSLPSLAWLEVKHHALKFIKETCPDIWCREQFEEQA
jgi:hypothetical protein